MQTIRVYLYKKRIDSVKTGSIVEHKNGKVYRVDYSNSLGFTIRKLSLFPFLFWKGARDFKVIKEGGLYDLKSGDKIFTLSSDYHLNKGKVYTSEKGSSWHRLTIAGEDYSVSSHKFILLKTKEVPSVALEFFK